MKATRDIQRQARQLFRWCQVNGLLDESRLRQAVETISTEKPRGYLSLLQSLTRLARLDIERRRVVVETASDASPTFRESFSKALLSRRPDAAGIQFLTNPSLLGGVRVQIGNDVWDHSVSGRLDALAKSI